MSDPRQHHYVPKVYLRNFCYDKEKEHLYAYDKHTKKAFTPHIENIAQERDYNTVTALEDKYYYEKYFSSNVEPKLGKLLDRIISKSILSYGNAEIIDKKTREGLSKMLAFQIFRTLNARKLMREKADELSTNLVENLLHLPQFSSNEKTTAAIENLRIFSEDQFRELALPITIDEKRIEMYSSILDSMLCTLYQNITTEPFITSDSPIIIRRLATKQMGFGSAGLAYPDCTLVYPISPNLAAIMLHRDSPNTPGFTKYENRLCPITNPAIIQTLNRWQLKQAYRQVYSNSPLQF